MVRPTLIVQAETRMYRPTHFREDRLDVLHQLMRAHPLATLVTNGLDGLTGNHIPFVLHDDSGDLGMLRGHVARANPLWSQDKSTNEVLVIFQGPDSYITPSWYPSKKVHGKVVPTWNYIAVHAHGCLNIIENDAWLRAHLDTLVTQQEFGRPEPWGIEDAPDDFITWKMKGIVGLEMPIAGIEGKWKASQNQAPEDREGVSRGLKSETGDAATTLSKLVSRYDETN